MMQDLRKLNTRTSRDEEAQLQRSSVTLETSGIAVATINSWFKSGVSSSMFIAFESSRESRETSKGI